MKTTKEIINNHLVNEGLSLINKTEQGKEYLKLQWFSVSDVEQLQKELINRYCLSKVLGITDIGECNCTECYNLKLIFNNFKGK